MQDSEATKHIDSMKTNYMILVIFLCAHFYIPPNEMPFPRLVDLSMFQFWNKLPVLCPRSTKQSGEI